jgi:dihydroneopterin aldolase
MTGFLASVRDVAEAGLVLRAGVDVLDVKEPSAGSLGAVDESVLRGVVDVARGTVPVSATIGDLPPVPERILPAILRTRAAGADIVKVGLFAGKADAALLGMLAGVCARGARIVLVVFAELSPGDLDLESIRRAGVTGVMLDTRDKHTGSLCEKLGLVQLGEFVSLARGAGLMVGLAGSLRATDIAPLLALAPDYLGFRGALCAEGSRTAGVDAAAVRGIASRIRTQRNAHPVGVPKLYRLTEEVI